MAFHGGRRARPRGGPPKHACLQLHFEGGPFWVHGRLGAAAWDLAVAAMRPMQMVHPEVKNLAFVGTSVTSDKHVLTTALQSLWLARGAQGFELN